MTMGNRGPPYPGHFWTLLPEAWEQAFVASGCRIARRQMSRLCWYGLTTPLPLAKVYTLHLLGNVASLIPTARSERGSWQCRAPAGDAVDAHHKDEGAGRSLARIAAENGGAISL